MWHVKFLYARVKPILGDSQMVTRGVNDVIRSLVLAVDVGGKVADGDVGVEVERRSAGTVMGHGTDTLVVGTAVLGVGEIGVDYIGWTLEHYHTHTHTHTRR